MEAQTVLVFMGLALFGVIFATLIPDNGCKNALKVLLSLTVTAALVSTLSGLDVLRGAENALSAAGKEASLETAYKDAGALLARLTEEQASVLIEEFTGTAPRYIRCYTEWTGENFTLSGLVAECTCENPEGVRKYLASRLGVDPAVINVTG